MKQPKNITAFADIVRRQSPNRIQTWTLWVERSPLAALSIWKRRHVGVGLDAVRWSTDAPHTRTLSTVLTRPVSTAWCRTLHTITARQRQPAHRLTWTEKPYHIQVLADWDGTDVFYERWEWLMTKRDCSRLVQKRAQCTTMDQNLTTTDQCGLGLGLVLGSGLIIS